MTIRRLCPQCHAPLPPAAADWLCPHCLLAQAGAIEPGRLPPNTDAHHPAERAAASLSSIHSFGDYELLEEIARGGMGVVYKARQISLNRIVAVKVLPFAKLAGAEFVQRFRTEAQAAANLRHANIVVIHEVGEHEGQPYFSMDYVEGGDLADLAAERPLPPSRAAAIVKTVAAAIHHAHQSGILHRDLKPSNILLDAEGQPRVTDFGVAKIMDSAGSGVASAESGDQAFGPQPGSSGSQRIACQSQLTHTGQVLGTPNYMSPEQAHGGRNLTGAADIYSLGALLYFLVTSRAPFAADSLQETLRQVHETEPASPRLLNPAVPRDLETICLKCLSKEPAQRYATARALADDLGRYLNGESILARPVRASEKLWRWCRRKPGVAALLAALVAVSAAGLAGIVWQWRSARSSAALERHQRERTEFSERVAVTNLWNSYLAQTRANRRSGRFGRRYDSLETVARAAAIRPSPELRDEAIAALALSDWRLLRHQTNLEPDATIVFDRQLERYAIGRTNTGDVSVRRLSDDFPLLTLPPIGATLRRVVSFSSDGRWLAVRYKGNQTHAWNLASRTSVVVRAAANTVNGPYADFRPGREEIAVGNGAGQVVICDLTTGKPRRTTTLPMEVYANHLSYSPDGSRLAAVESGFNVLVILDAESARVLETMLLPDVVHTFAWSSNGRYLATLHYREAWVWDARTGQKLYGPLRQQSQTDGIAFGGSEETLFTSGWDGSYVWNFRAQVREFVIPEPRSRLHVSSDGRRLVREVYAQPAFDWGEVASSSPVFYVEPPLPEQDESRHGEHDVAFSPDNTVLALAAGDRWKLFAAADGRELADRPTPGIRSIWFDTHTNLWLTGRHGCQCWPWRAGARIGEWSFGPPTFVGAPSVMGRAAASAGGRTISVVDGKRVTIFDAEARQEVARTPTNRTTVAFLAGSPDGRWVLTAPWHANGIRVHNAHDGSVSFVLTNSRWLGGFEKLAIAFGSDPGRLFISAKTDYSLWNTTTWQPLWIHSKPEDASVAAASPDGSLLAQRYGLHHVQILAADSGNVLGTLPTPGDQQPVRLCFSPDGTQLAIAFSDTRQAAVWNLRALRQELAALGVDWAGPPIPQRPLQPLANDLQVKFVAGSPEQRQQRTAAAAVIPPRHPETDPSRLDLTDYFNLALTDSWFPTAPSRDNSFAELPPGVLRLAGVEFDVRGIVQLAGASVATRDYPDRVAEIRIGRTFSVLHVLHGTRHGVADGTPIGRYVIHYAHGQLREWPLVYGRNVRNVWKRRNEPEGSPELVEAWNGHNLDATANQATIRLFKSTWKNPLPAEVIASIDFESALTPSEPLLVAVTAEP